MRYGARLGEELSAEQWKAIFHGLRRLPLMLIKKIPILHRLARKAYLNWKIVRSSCVLKKHAHSSPIRIVIGAGASGIFYDGWIYTDIECLNLLIRKHWERYFRKDSIDAMLAEHVWEHLTIHDGLVAARHCFEYLKPGGYLRVAVPDGFHPDPKYIEWVKVGGAGPGAYDHKVLYNHESLKNLFLKAGFRVELLEYFDSEGKFHFVNWDSQAGKIHRSRRFDKRNVNGESKYTSIILDAYKDA